MQLLYELWAAHSFFIKINGVRVDLTFSNVLGILLSLSNIDYDSVTETGCFGWEGVRCGDMMRPFIYIDRRQVLYFAFITLAAYNLQSQGDSGRTRTARIRSARCARPHCLTRLP